MVFVCLCVCVWVVWGWWVCVVCGVWVCVVCLLLLLLLLLLLPPSSSSGYIVAFTTRSLPAYLAAAGDVVADPPLALLADLRWVAAPPPAAPGAPLFDLLDLERAEPLARRAFSELSVRSSLSLERMSPDIYKEGDGKRVYQ